MATSRCWLLTLVTLQCLNLAWAGKVVSKRPAAHAPDEHPAHPIFREARSWARARAEYWIERGAKLDFANPDNDGSLYKDLFRDVLEKAPTIVRNVAFAELFAGYADTTRFVTVFGYRAYAYDRKYGDDLQDICTIGGLLYAFYLVTAVVHSGVVHCSPQCSTW
eukprot:3463851-Pyramimonas_sp.AAC.1